MRILCSSRKPMRKTPVSGFPRALRSLSHARKRRTLASRLTFTHSLLPAPFSQESLLRMHGNAEMEVRFQHGMTRETIISSTAFQIQILNKTQSLAAFGCEQFRKQGFAGGLLKYKYIKESFLLHSVFQRPEKSASVDHLPCRWS